MIHFRFLQLLWTKITDEKLRRINYKIRLNIILNELFWRIPIIDHPFCSS